MRPSSSEALELHDMGSEAGRGAAQRDAADTFADEPVAAAGERLDEAWRRGRISQRFTQPLHCGVQAVLEVHEGAVVPQLATEVFARDDGSRLPEEERQYSKGLLEVVPELLKDVLRCR
jgi:hypothetical protein